MATRKPSSPKAPVYVLSDGVFWEEARLADGRRVRVEIQPRDFKISVRNKLVDRAPRKGGRRR